MGEWWDKLRRAWVALRSGLQLKCLGRSPGNGKEKRRDKGAKSEAEEGENAGYLKLQRDVENCKYEDIHVMWNMVMAELSTQGEQAAACATGAQPI